MMIQVAHVFWGSKTPTTCHIMVWSAFHWRRALICFVTVVLLITEPQDDVVVNLWRVLCCWSVTPLASCLSKDTSLTYGARYIKIWSKTEPAHSITYLPSYTEKGWIVLPRQRHSVKGQLSFAKDIQELMKKIADGTNRVSEFLFSFVRLYRWTNH